MHSTAQHSTAQHSTAQHSTVQHSTAQHSTAQHSTAQHSITQHNTAQHTTAQHNTAQHNTAQHSITQHSTIQHSTAQHSTVQHSYIVEGGMATCLCTCMQCPHAVSFVVCGVLHPVQVDTVHRAFEARKEYVATWLSAHEAAVLEYDTEGFTFVSFLFEIKGFYSLVHCEWRPGSMSDYGGCWVVVRTYVRT